MVEAKDFIELSERSMRRFLAVTFTFFVMLLLLDHYLDWGQIWDTYQGPTDLGLPIENQRLAMSIMANQT